MSVRAKAKTRARERVAPRHARAAAFSLVVALLATSLLLAQPPSGPTDIQVEATFLYKFGSFVTWPNSAPNDVFNICVLGRDPFGPNLDAIIKGESIGGKRLVASRIANVQEAAQCRIVYVSSSEDPRTKAILTELAKMPVLTVSDMPHFVDRGGIIQFVLENGRVRFEVSLASAEKSGLTLSSQLLKVASAVRRDGAGN